MHARCGAQPRSPWRRLLALFVNEARIGSGDDRASGGDVALLNPLRLIPIVLRLDCGRGDHACKSLIGQSFDAPFRRTSILSLIMSRPKIFRFEVVYIFNTT